ncbi:MAG TPA: DUF885 family protein [Myxococcales bacterium]
MILAILLALTSVDSLTSEFIERWFTQYPSRATQAGRSELDAKLEDFSTLPAWLAYLDTVDERARQLKPANRDDRLDLHALRRAVAEERLKLRQRAQPGRNPGFWTGVVSESVIYLLLREDQPHEHRVKALDARARQVPRLCAQAKAALSKTKADQIAPEHLDPARKQALQLGRLFSQNFARFDPSLSDAGQVAGKALMDFAAFLDKLPASGSARLGKDYDEVFRIGLDETETPAQLLPRFEQDLVALRAEAALYGAEVWSQLVSSEPMPQDEKARLRRLFAAIETDRDIDVAVYTRRWQESVLELAELVRKRQVITLPEPLTLKISPAPAYLAGQAYGGVFPAGPYHPDGDTLLLLPVPPDTATLAQKAEFFAAFNRPFSKMIAAHEALPGHYVQLKIAAHQAHPIRTLFPDDVYEEGWGTFVEGLMLEQGWGGPKERIAHLKKALENCARAIADIRVHKENATKEDIAKLVREDALLDPQLGANLWLRALTSSPQIVTYHLGAARFRALYDAARKTEGARFSLRAFTDRLMSLGPVPIREYE